MQQLITMLEKFNQKVLTDSQVDETSKIGGGRCK